MRICSTCGERNEDWMDICQRCGSSIMNANVDNTYTANYNYDNYSNNGYDDNYNNANGYYSGPVSSGNNSSRTVKKPIENLDLKIILIILIIILICLILYVIFA